MDAEETFSCDYGSAAPVSTSEEGSDCEERGVRELICDFLLDSTALIVSLMAESDGTARCRSKGPDDSALGKSLELPMMAAPRGLVTLLKPHTPQE